MAATENVSKVLPYGVVGTPVSSEGVSKVVMYAIVNTLTPPSPPAPHRRSHVWVSYGKMPSAPA